MSLKIAGAGLILALVTLTGHRASAEAFAAGGTTPKARTAPPDVTAPPASRPTFVPEAFNVPVLVETVGFKLVPLGPDLVKIDFDAYMSSIEHLQKTFSRSSKWPHQNISAAEAMRDMENEKARFTSRRSFAYAALTPDGSRERGSIYVRPSSVKGYDAVVSLWVSKAEYDAGFDAELYRWVTEWVQRDWPFTKVAYPGRAIGWDDWDALVASSTASSEAPN